MHFLGRIKSSLETPPGKATVSAASQWLDLFDALPEERKPWSRVSIVLGELSLANQVRDREIVTPLFKRLEDHTHPLLQLLGKRRRMTHDWSLAKANADTQVEQIRTLLKEAIQTLDKLRQQGNHAAASDKVRFLDESFNTLAVSGWLHRRCRLESMSRFHTCGGARGAQLFVKSK